MNQDERRAVNQCVRDIERVIGGLQLQQPLVTIAWGYHSDLDGSVRIDVHVKPKGAT